MNFNALSLTISSVYIGASLALVVLSISGKEPPTRLFDLAIASLGTLGALLVTPPKK